MDNRQTSASDTLPNKKPCSEQSYHGTVLYFLHTLKKTKILL